MEPVERLAAWPRPSRAGNGGSVSVRPPAAAGRRAEGADVHEQEFLRAVATDPEAAWGSFLDRYSFVIDGVIRLFSDSYDDRMDLFVFASEKLKEDRMRRVRAYQFRPEAPCTLASYLAVVVRNLALDFVRGTHGRYRPFRCVSGLDSVDRLVFEYHLKHRRSLSEVCHLLATQHGIRIDLGELTRRRDRIEKGLTPSQRWRLLSRLWAGRRAQSVDPVDATISDAAGRDLPLRSAAKSPEAALRSRAAREAFREAVGRIEAHKRLVLALRYKDGCKIRDIARVVHATEKQVEHWVRESTAAIRDRLAELDVGPDDLDPDHLTDLWEG